MNEQILESLTRYIVMTNARAQLILLVLEERGMTGIRHQVNEGLQHYAQGELFLRSVESLRASFEAGTEWDEFWAQGPDPNPHQ